MPEIQNHIFENLETYKDLFDNAHDLIHLVEPDGTVMYVNKSWSTVLGFSADEIRGQSIYSIVEEKDRNRFIAYRDDILKGSNPEGEIIVAFRTKAGGIVHLEGFVSLKIFNDKPLYTRGIFHDVTKRLNNEAKLQAMNDDLLEREANLQNLLHYAPDAVVVIDDNSHVMYWNPKAELIFGWTPEQVLGKRLTEFIIPSKYRLAHEEGMKRYLTTGEIHVLNRTIEITALNKSGKEFYVSLTISSTHQKGKTAFIAFIRDIDQQKRNALELDQKKLQLEESNEQLERFAHVTSHDMREPIRKIQLYIERLKTDSRNQFSLDSETYILRVENAASRLMQIVKGVLAYSILNAKPTVFEPVDLNKIIRDVEEDLELVIQQREAVISYHNLPVIEGVSFLLHQLFYNLIHNALKFSRPDISPKVEIASKTLPLGDIKLTGQLTNVTYYEITVKDNGIGFLQEHAEEIFTMFYRLHSKDKFEGTGLGLSVCKKIVEKHHGTIKALGVANTGTSIVIRLPGKQVR